MAFQAIRAQADTMSIPRYLALGFVALVIVSCAAPGGIYKGYEGPDRAPGEVAVLEWSTHPGGRVNEIDGVYLHETQPFFGGVATTVAQLLPATYRIKVNNNYANYLDTKADITLITRLEAGHTYKLQVDACYGCDPFSVHFSIIDSATGKAAYESKLYGSRSRREIREEEVEKCKSRCERACFGYVDSDDFFECVEEESECEDACEPSWFFR